MNRGGPPGRKRHERPDKALAKMPNSILTKGIVTIIPAVASPLLFRCFYCGELASDAIGRENKSEWFCIDCESIFDALEELN